MKNWHSPRQPITLKVVWKYVVWLGMIKFPREYRKIWKDTKSIESLTFELYLYTTFCCTKFNMER